MIKRNLATRTLAGAAVMGVSMLAFAPAASATHDGTGRAESSASTGTGAIFELLDTGACTAVDTETTEAATPTGRCGDGLSLNDQINAFTQTAAAPGDGTSEAFASVAPIDIQNAATALDLTGILEGALEDIDTGTVLDDVILGLDPVTQALINPLKDAAVAPIDDALQATVLPAIFENLPITLQIGAVESRCVADDTTAEGNGTVAGINLLVQLGPEQIVVPIQAGTAPNSNLLVGAPQDLVDGIIDGLEDTVNQSLGGALGGLAPVFDTIQTQLLAAVFEALEPTLLQQLADALEPLVSGTVNKQVPVSPSSTGEIEVTSLDLTLLSAAGANAQNLQLGRTQCGPNSQGGPHTPDDGDPTPTPPNNPGPGPGTPGDLPDVPTSVTSGAVDTTDPLALALTASGGLMMLAAAGGIMRRRFADLG